MSSQSSQQPASASQASAVRISYLILYNLDSAMVWSVVLYRTLAVFLNAGTSYVFPATGELVRWTQTAAALEILHSLFGIVRSPFLTTFVQVYSRYLLVWGVTYFVPSVAYTPWYTSMLIAWSVTEVIRYTYFAVTLAGYQSKSLTWLRYNTFFVLYPLGISSECALMYLATEPAAKTYGDLYKWALYANLAFYVPGAYFLYTYMMKQNRKVMRGGNSKNEKKTQ